MKTLVLVGGFSNTIEVFELSLDAPDANGITCEFKFSSHVEENPSFLDKSQNGIYSIHEVKLQYIIQTWLTGFDLVLSNSLIITPLSRHCGIVFIVYGN